MEKHRLQNNANNFDKEEKQQRNHSTNFKTLYHYGNPDCAVAEEQTHTSMGENRKPQNRT